MDAGSVAHVGQPFPHNDYLSKLTALRDQLRAGLSGATPEDSSKPALGPAELAGLSP